MIIKSIININRKRRTRGGDEPTVDENYSLTFTGDTSGTSDHVVTNFNPDTYNLNLGFTVSYWVRPDAIGATRHALGRRAGSSHERFFFGIHTDRINVGIGKNVVNLDGVRNYNSKATDYAEEKRICAVTFDAKVGEKWYKTKGFYIYGPEMSQNEACNKAKDKAKVAVLEQHTPQLVTNDVEHACTEKTPEKVVKQDAQPIICLLYTSPSPRDGLLSRMPSSA